MRSTLTLLIIIFVILTNGCSVQINSTHSEINVRQGTKNIPNEIGYFDFGNIPINYSQTITFTIENLGDESLYLNPANKVAISGMYKDEFIVASNQTVPIILANKSTTFSVTFFPKSLGKKSANISITNTDADENPYTFLIIGTCVSRAAEINVKVGSIDLISNSGLYDFGIAKLNSTTDYTTFIIENNGNMNLHLTGSPNKIAISGTDASMFIIDQKLTSSIIPGISTTSFKIAFNPTSRGVKTAKISILNTDIDENPYTFNLIGTCASAPEINVTQNGIDIPNDTGSFNFGDINIDESSDEIEFRIENKGSETLHLTDYPKFVSISGNDATMFSAIVTGTKEHVAPGSYTSIKLIFSPTVEGSKDATISIPNNDDNENPYVFSLVGNCVGPEINIKHANESITNSSGELDFGYQMKGSSSFPVVFEIENTGMGKLRLTGNPKIVIQGANSSMFSVSQSTTASIIESNDSTTFKVYFTPTSLGSKTATISIANNDLDENPYTFTIKGNCIDYMSGLAIGWIGQNLDGWQRGSTSTSGSDYKSFYIVSSTFIDSEGNIYVSDTYNHRICKWTSTGRAIGWIGGGSDGWKTNSNTSLGSDYRSFYSPEGIYVDSSGNIFVADNYNHRISKWDKEGKAIGWIGGQVSSWSKATINPVSARGSDYSRFYYPKDVCVDSSGNIFVADSYNNRISKWSAQGSAIGWIGNRSDGWKTSYASYQGYNDYRSFDDPSGVSLDSSGNIFVADNDNQRISKWNSQGYAQGWIGGGIDGWRQSSGTNSGSQYKYFNDVNGIYVANGYIYVADRMNQRISKWSLSGNAVGWIGGGSDGWKTGNAPSGTFDYRSMRYPHDVFVDSNGNIFIADRYNNRVDKWID